jgi:hypothetical protein
MWNRKSHVGDLWRAKTRPRVACRSPRGLRLPGRLGPNPILGGLLFEAVHQLTQVVASIAKSSPQHYADISFFARRLCLADLGKVIKSCFEFLLQEIAPYSKRNFIFFRIVWHKSARMHGWGSGGEVSYPSARKRSPLKAMFLKDCL